MEAMRQAALEETTSLEITPLKTAINDVESVARDFVEGVGALGQQAQELADSTEMLRVQTLQRSDEKIDALEQTARELANCVESSRLDALSKSNTEVRKLNEELDQRVSERTAELEAANDELDAYSYSISHDLRAPLRAIDGFARILSEDHYDTMTDAGKHCVEMVRHNVGTMRQLIDGLLAFSRLGLQSLSKNGIEPGQMVRECLDELAIEQEDRSVEIVIGDMPACRADSVLLKQVWTNLLSNALKYTRNQQSARIEIGCRTEPRSSSNGSPSPAGAGSDVVYFVKDNGAGFDMKYADKLFGVFQRLHKAKDFEGTGVGLAISQRIIQRHGGRIWAEAKPNEGAMFSFTLN